MSDVPAINEGWDGSDGTYKPADPKKTEEAWVSMVQPLARRDGLDKLPTRQARTTRDRDKARVQNRLATARTFTVPALPWHTTTPRTNGGWIPDDAA